MYHTFTNESISISWVDFFKNEIGPGVSLILPKSVTRPEIRLSYVFEAGVVGTKHILICN